MNSQLLYLFHELIVYMSCKTAKHNSERSEAVSLFLETLYQPLDKLFTLVAPSRPTIESNIPIFLEPALSADK